MRLRESEVDDVEDVAEQKDVNANVRMFEASSSDHSKYEPSGQESRAVGILLEVSCANAQVKTFKALLDVSLLQGLPPIMQKPEEVDWNDYQNNCEQDSQDRAYYSRTGSKAHSIECHHTANRSSEVCL